MKTFRDYGIDVPDTFSGEKYTTCPQCSPGRKKPKDKCLSVNGDKGTWFCHHPHCGWKGALKGNYLQGSYTPPQKIYKKPEQPNWTPLPEKYISHFKTRGINTCTLRRNKIAHDNGAVLFPFYRNAELINIKHRGKGKKFWMEKECERIFYGLDDISGDEVIICEGEIDKLSLEEAGFISVLSVPSGAPSPESKNHERTFDYLESAADVIARINHIIIAGDNDLAGINLQEELVRRIGKEKCSYVKWPDDCKDANDVLVKHGEELLAKCVESAIPYPIEGIFEPKDIFPDIDRVYKQGFQKGESPGWISLERLYTVRPGEWTLVSGIPSHGKTTFLDNVLVNLTRKGWKIAIYSPENQPLERHAVSLLEKIIKLPFTDGPQERMDEHDLAIGKEYLQEYFSFILPEDDISKLDSILRLAKALVLRKGINGLVIDPWNELDHSRSGGLTETEHISASLSKLRKFARVNGIHIWLVAHPTKLRKQDNGKYPVPTPYDVSGSAHFRNKADNALCVWRDVQDNSLPVQVHVQKIRFKEVGEMGVAEFRYNKTTGVYKEY